MSIDMPEICECGDHLTPDRTVACAKCGKRMCRACGETDGDHWYCPECLPDGDDEIWPRESIATRQ